ncbi:MAG: DUF58 domain-containing protein [Acidobacteriota bacterium]
MTIPSPIDSIKHSESACRFIDPVVLSRIRGLSLVARTVVEGFISGLHRSPYHGFSMEFAEYRAYTPGDDIRSVDWKVYARNDKFFVKKYEGDTNTQLYLLLDCSKSMAFSSHALSKLDYGRFLAASLAYLAQRQKDAVGLLTFDSQVLRYTPARIRRGQYQMILHHLNETRAGRLTDVSAAIRDLARFTRKRNLVAVISDFYQDPEEVAKALRIFQLRGNDLILFHLLDPVELDPPFSKVSTLEDMESEERLTYVPESRERYLKRLRQHIHRLRRESAAINIDYELIGTDQPLDRTLHRYLTARAKKF